MSNDERTGRFVTRRGLLVTGLAGSLAACDRLHEDQTFRSLLGATEKLNQRTQRLITDRAALAREYRADQRSPVFRTNGNVLPASPVYRAHLAQGFANWRLRVDGLVSRPLALSLAQIRAMPQRSQITRHDCVEGWSAIGGWTGVPLRLVLELAGLRDGARFVVFHCSDDYGGAPYYESIDLIDAFHPQTILAWAMNGAPLPVGHGAPLRLRVERMLGYKHAKFIERIEVRSTLAGLGRGKGGTWEDLAGYEWYAGI